MAGSDSPLLSSFFGRGGVSLFFLPLLIAPPPSLFPFLSGRIRDSAFPAEVASLLSGLLLFFFQDGSRGRALRSLLFLIMSHFFSGGFCVTDVFLPSTSFRSLPFSVSVFGYAE